MNTEDLLAKLVLGSLPLEKFEVAFEEDVGFAADEVCQQVLVTDLPKKGRCHLYRLRGGLTVVEDAKGRWSCYESRERVEEREFYSAWNSFVRGTWVKRTPSVPGIYPTRDLEGRRGRDRELRLVHGKLRDTTLGGGFQNPTQVSSWQGFWWSSCYPALRGAL